MYGGSHVPLWDRAHIVMLLLLTPSFNARLCQGGVGSANHGDRFFGQSLVFAPMPRGTDIACPAGRS